MKSTAKHILVIRLSAMGDVAMTVPVLRALLNQYPDVKVTVVTRSFFSPFFDDLERVSIFCPDLKGKHEGFWGLFRLHKELLRLNIDYVADLHNVLRSKALIALFKIKGYKSYQIDKGRKEKKELTAPDQNKRRIPLKSTHERYADVFRKLGYAIDLSYPYKVSKKNIPSSIKDLIKDQKSIGIAPFAAYESKSLPETKLNELIDDLSNLNNTNILLFGGGNEQKQLFESIESKYDNVYSLVQKVSFKEELDIIANLSVMISMDSGNGHMAAMYDVPVITIWGVTHPYLGFTPFKQPIENQILPDLEKYPLIPTSVYGKDFPDGYLNCFDTINIDDIISQIKKYL
ncbi:glycosyltransferase family 9 protein [Tenacibaculum xiamenense]|uniref:glycosyltransferase family 9 protein n=1 Tax=Tenacibaculum xiamenense TaxID=1261553 RepID=UPI00389408CC